MEKCSAEETNSLGEIEFAKEKKLYRVSFFSFGGTNSVGEENFHKLY